MSWKEKKRRMAGAAAVIFFVLYALVMCGAGKRIPSPQAALSPLDKGRCPSTASGAGDQERAYPEYSGVVEYIVKGDDTLLGIAYKMCPDDLPNEAYYRYARDIKRLNGRETDILYWKETIKIYTFGEDGR